jgi:hypothetical protein
VVVSGLDFLKDEVKAISGPVKASLEGLLHEMTVATKSAVNILNDVLDYEQIDAGKLSKYLIPPSAITPQMPAGILKLDLGWFPLARFFEDKFKWAEMMASIKQIRLTIEDNTVATVPGMRRLLQDVSRESSSSIGLVVRDIEGDIAGIMLASPCASFITILYQFCLLEGDEAISNSARENRFAQLRGLPPFARSFLHVDDAKIDQFLRNVVTNAVRIGFDIIKIALW